VLLCPQICQNVRTGGSDQPPVAESEPVRAKAKSLPGSVGQIRCLPQPEQLHGLEPERARKGADDGQNDLVVAGIDVAKDKVDVCVRSLSLSDVRKHRGRSARADLVAAPDKVGKAVNGGDGRLRA